MFFSKLKEAILGLIGEKCSMKLKKCVADVKAKGGATNPYAVCKASLEKGKKKSKKEKK